MERKDASIARRSIKTVVIVADAGGSDFCSGFVAKTSGESTHVVTQADFVKGRENNDLKVCFFDKTELPASAVVIGTLFCILRTGPHRHCKEITVMEGEVTPSRVLMFPPSSPTDLYHTPGFIILESVDAYGVGPTVTDHIDVSERCFELTCHYGDKCLNGRSRLLGAPVFSMTGDVEGLVTGDFRPNAERGQEIKLGLLAKYIVDMVNTLMPQLMKSKKGGDEGSSKHKRSDASKRKRGGEECSSKEKSATNKTKRGGVEGSSEDKRSDASKRKKGGDKGSSTDKSAANKKQRAGDKGKSKGKRSASK